MPKDFDLIMAAVPGGQADAGFFGVSVTTPPGPAPGGVGALRTLPAGSGGGALTLSTGAISGAACARRALREECLVHHDKVYPRTH